MVQIRAKTATSRGLFAGIRQCRETTALRAAPLRAFAAKPDETTGNNAYLTSTSSARGAALHSNSSVGKRVYP
ncbi:conserved hypothetical protein [Burkholderia ambifaria AMMD]|uniref:Uncharacterized protein n=1 Tax=Burkholderia ambifaria (strain ATCC BAA-244 / DSM 16087 / CCUG 44356 / LMG 19182 / AMMD) TaxID=339670 RepID=Q0BI21_BURCM|nr:conserved hypothetical protein [Burkholderia ambifaria AMMD]